MARKLAGKSRVKQVHAPNQIDLFKQLPQPEKSKSLLKEEELHNINKDMIKNAELGYPRAVSKSLKEGADPNSIDAQKMTGLLWAIENDDVKMAEIFLNDKRTDLNYNNEYNENLVFIASRKGSIKVLTKLLDKLEELGKLNLIEQPKIYDELPISIAKKHELKDLFLNYRDKIKN